MQYYVSGGGGGCYPDSTFLLMIDSDGNYRLKKPGEIRAGDTVLGYKKSVGYSRLPVVIMEKHEGTFDMQVSIDKTPVVKNIDL